MESKTVLEIYDEFCVPVHIRRHMVMVCAVATVIAGTLRDIDFKSLQYACLLHDALKIYTINNYETSIFRHNVSAEDTYVWEKLKQKHINTADSQAMADYLTAKGETKIGTIIQKHDFSSINKPEFQPYSLEEKILYYADKRVLHDQVVSLEERITDGRIRYPQNKAQTMKGLVIENILFELETELLNAELRADLRHPSQQEFLKLAVQYL